MEEKKERRTVGLITAVEILNQHPKDLFSASYRFDGSEYSRVRFNDFFSGLSKPIQP